MPVSRLRPVRRVLRSAASAARDVVVGGVQVVAVLLAAPLLRRWYRAWGTEPAERTERLPGDDLVAAPLAGYTRAITVAAPVTRVWPWLAQMGQGRGGFYSYDGLENLVRCRITSADVVLPEFQQPRPGDVIRLAAGGGPCFQVQEVRPPTTLVLVSADPADPARVSDAGRGEPVATWQWVARPVDGGRRTRLTVRQRLTYPPGQRLLWQVVDPVSFVMERRMLRGIKRRAEAAA